MVKPVKMQRVKRTKSLDFESLIASGQNPNGFTAQTANGTAKAGNCAGWNRAYQPASPQPYVEATGAWSNSNRSAE